MIPEYVIWNVSKESIKQAIHFACKKLCNSENSYPKDRFGLVPRGIAERLVNKIMGDIAESAVLEFLKAEGVKAVLYDEIRQDDFESPDLGWDISLGESVVDWQGINPRKSWPKISGSIRSSQISFEDVDIDRLINRFQFIIHALPGKSIEKCLTSDLEICVFFNKKEYYRKELSSLKQKLIISLAQECMNSIDSCDQLNDLLNISQRFEKCYLIAWNLKTRIVKDSYSMDQRTWTVQNGNYKKEMWSAPLRRGRSMIQLPALIKAYKRLVA